MSESSETLWEFSSRTCVLSTSCLWTRLGLGTWKTLDSESRFMLQVHGCYLDSDDSDSDDDRQQETSYSRIVLRLVLRTGSHRETWIPRKIYNYCSVITIFPLLSCLLMSNYSRFNNFLWYFLSPSTSNYRDVTVTRRNIGHNQSSLAQTVLTVYCWSISTLVSNMINLQPVSESESNISGWKYYVLNET